MILNYEQRGKHSSTFPEHKSSILTSSQFASEMQFYQTAFMNNKVVEKNDGTKLVIQPCLFDPKKGYGHMKMIEELSKEMHSENQIDFSPLSAPSPSLPSKSHKPFYQTSKIKKATTDIEKAADDILIIQQNLTAYLGIEPYDLNPQYLEDDPQEYRTNPKSEKRFKLSDSS